MRMVVSRLALPPKMSASRVSTSSSSASTIGKYWSTTKSMIACSTKPGPLASRCGAASQRVRTSA